jgi:hypothetical protein
MSVWPDTLTADDQTFDGFYLCAALAGLASGVVPQQGLTNMAIEGFQAVDRTTKLFSRTDLDIMAGSGVWIVTQDVHSGAVFSRHALTSGPYKDINQREEVITYTRLYELSIYYVGSRTAGDASMDRVLGPKALSQAFYAAYATSATRPRTRSMPSSTPNAGTRPPRGPPIPIPRPT